MLRAQQVECVIDLQNSRRTALYRRWILSATQWVGRRPSAPQPVSGLKGLVELLEGHGISASYLNAPDIAWLAADVASFLKQHAITKPYIVLIPGASAAHPEKRWPHYAALANKLLMEGKEVVSILGPDELSLADTLPGHVFTSLSWFALAGIIQQASFVLGNDTGPCHLASCLNKRGLAIFGPSTSSARSELARANFHTVETSELQTLTAEAVLQRINF